MHLQEQHLHRKYRAGLRVLDDLGQWLDARPLLLWVLLAVTYWMLLIPVCWYRPLWHDELFTYNFGRMSSIGTMLRDIPRIDLNPPITYLLEYVSLHLAGPFATGRAATITARIPSLLAGFIASCGLFIYLRRKVGALLAVVGVVWLWQTPFWGMCNEDRPYALFIAFLVWLLIAWERASQPGRSMISLIGAWLLAIGMMGTHFMAALVLPAFWAAEAMRAFRAKKIDLPLTFAFVAPFIIPVVYHSLIHGYDHMLFPPAFQANLHDLKLFFTKLPGSTSCLLVSMMVALLLSRASPPAAESGTDREDVVAPSLWRFRPEDVVLLGGILCEPFLSLLIFKLQHSAYFLRYALPGTLPLVVFFTWLFAWRFRSHWKRIAATAFVIGYAFLFFANYRSLLLLLLDHDRATVQAVDWRSIDPQLPFVVDSGLVFVEMNHRESPQFLNRVYYLTDQNGAIQYAHATLFQHEDEVAEIFGFRAHVEKLNEFELQHEKFLVLGSYSYPENWLLRYLLAQGDELRFLGEFKNNYQAKELYEVTLKPRS